MNRTEFMEELASLLQDIPDADRRDAMHYYNDYFDDAGAENEQQVIAELGNPGKVAGTIKADMSGHNERYSEYSEIGYTDTRFEQKEAPARYHYQSREHTDETPPRTSRIAKILLIIAVILVGIPVVLPVAGSIFAAICGLLAALAALLIGLVAAAFVIAVVGVILVSAGIASLVPELAAGLALIGIGLILGAIGAVATAGSIKLCIIVCSSIFQGSVRLCRKLLHRGKAVA